MTRWGLRPIDTGRRGNTEYHAVIYIIDLDAGTCERTARPEWVQASHIIAGSAGRGGQPIRQA